MAVSTAARRSRTASPKPVEKIEVPREFIELLAYEKFERRGRVHGEDIADWLGAERELRELFRQVSWSEVPDSSAGFVINARGPVQAVEALCRYIQLRPRATASRAGKAAQFRVVWPDAPADRGTDDHPESPMDHVKKNATAEQARRAKAARSPVSALSGEQFSKLKGNLVALLLEGPEKGKVIATAPLNPEHPEMPRRSIKDQVDASAYKGRRYQVRQVLDATARK
ncbi:MAG: DUF2934 domain-containing protein [Planctomycetia bacterium]|nr:DUF2934 domain-containing protein [Planctomycetia bacterium]